MGGSDISRERELKRAGTLDKGGLTCFMRLEGRHYGGELMMAQIPRGGRTTHTLEQVHPGM